MKNVIWCLVAISKEIVSTKKKKERKEKTHTLTCVILQKKKMKTHVLQIHFQEGNL